jgi:CubicO group peptidase (beta-lactamase class C family)
LLVGDGALRLDGPAPVPAWAEVGDPRRDITLDHLLRMVDGLDFVEYDPEGRRADVIEMLRDARRVDTATDAEGRAPRHAPGSVFNYSSGSSMIVSAIVRRGLAGRRIATVDCLRARLFDPLGMVTARPRVDGAGTFIGSSYVFATAHDFARFGLLYLRDGVWEGRRLLPAGWVDHARRPTPASGGLYGAHWWRDVGPEGAWCAKGFRGQYVVLVPDRDLIVVRLGVSTDPQRLRVVEMLGEIIRCFDVPAHDDLCRESGGRSP